MDAAFDRKEVAEVVFFFFCFFYFSAKKSVASVTILGSCEVIYYFEVQGSNRVLLQVPVLGCCYWLIFGKGVMNGTILGTRSPFTT